ncbi:SDR family NAD(P)-dependent oxidoreductase [[Mycobacterium] fortunisiensis]|nr:SDR family NAD(P)-dependent oxidoreductase [[Mycobacterium] fortunisiensis]
MGLLAGRVAILTGGAGSLGSAMSRLLAAEGASVVVNDVNIARAQKIVDKIVAAGGNAVADDSDVSTMAGGSAVVQRALDQFGTVDVLVLLAGQVAIKSITKLTEEDWDRVIGIHMKGHFSVLKAALPTMIDKKYGRVIAVSSVDGTIGDAYMSPYCAAKAGILGFARAAAIELDEHGITVNTICPSGIPGDLGPIATKLAGPPAGNAPLVAYLASEESGWLNGHVFDVSGSGRIGLYPPYVPSRLVSKEGGYTVEELRNVVPALFEPTYTIEPRQRPRLLPKEGESEDRLPKGFSAIFAEVTAGAGVVPQTD